MVRTRVFAILLCAGILFFSLVGGIKAQAPAPPVDTVTARFTVAAPREWQPTRIRVEVGDRVSIQYLTGKWHSQPDEPLHGPDGQGSYTCSGMSCVEPLPGYPKGGLVGRIGDAGPVFAVGSQKSFTADADGVLELRINDVGVYDAEGSVTMQITVDWTPPLQ